MTAVKADPGIGRESAPVGSKAWAERVRLHMQGLVSSVRTKPEGLKFYVDLVKEHQAWTLMNRDDGSTFHTFEEFCEYRQPWGLGRPWAELRLYLVAVCDGNEAQVEALTTKALADPAPPPAHIGPGRGHTSNGVDNDKPRLPKGGTASTYLAARIARDSPDVHERMKAGEFKSVRQAAIAAGVVKVKPKDTIRIAAKAFRAVPSYRLAEFVGSLTADECRLLSACLKDRIRVSS